MDKIVVKYIYTLSNWENYKFKKSSNNNQNAFVLHVHRSI